MKSKENQKYLPPRKVKIIESKYLETSDLIRWTLFFYDNGTEQIYVWPSVDLLASLNIKGKTTTEMLHKFCDSMTGRDLNFVIDKEPELPEVKITEKEYKNLNQQMHTHFDTFKNTVLGE